MVDDRFGSQPTNDGETDGRASDVSELMALLAHRRRRYLLYHLRRQPRSTTLAEAAEWIAMLDEDVTADRHLSDALERVRLDLYHVHVPKLVDADVVDVDYDESTGLLTLTDTRPPFERILEEALDHEKIDADCEIAN